MAVIDLAPPAQVAIVLTLVDVRSTDDFQRLHIPGSLNIPLYAVKTKIFLKSFPMVQGTELNCQPAWWVEKMLPCLLAA